MEPRFPTSSRRSPRLATSPISPTWRVWKTPGSRRIIRRKRIPWRSRRWPPWSQNSLGDLKFTFHPAARLLRSDYPAASIWAGSQGQGEFAPPEDWRGEETLVTRPGADVRLRILPVGGYSFARPLQDGATLGEAHAAAMHIEGFDPGEHVIGLIVAGAISRLGI